MRVRGSVLSAGPRDGLKRFAYRLRRWWRSQDAEEQYLATATNLAELERRLRALERANGGPAFAPYMYREDDVPIGR